jgi:ABC-2 type transport system ATP-binding protein
MNTTAPTPALYVENITFSYGLKKALDNVSFSINQGECTLLLGENGAGKSTLFALITHLYNSPSGRILLSGFDIQKKSTQALAVLGVVFQQSTLDVDLSVVQNLRYHAALHGMSGKLASNRIQEELERLAMYERRNEKVRQLNGGHKRRVEIARALLHKPSVLLLDEPTVGLDIPSRKGIVDYVHQLVCHEQIAVLWASHLIDEVHLNDRLIVLHQGQIKANGYTHEILQATQKEELSEAFNMLTAKN